MPASEGFYRDQKALHVVFFLSALGLFGGTIWMLADDHFKPWKRYQQEFVTVSREKMQDDLSVQEAALDQAKLDDLDKRLAEAKSALDSRKNEIAQLQASVRALQTTLEKQDRALAFRKADQAAAASQFDLIVAQLGQTSGDSDPARRVRLERQKATIEENLKKLDSDIANGTIAVEDTKGLIADADKKIKDFGADVEKITVEREKLTSDRDSLARTVASAKYGAAERIRALPILDGFASPVRVKQVALDDLPLDYNFKMVTRYDRCQTCHLGIDKPGYTKQDGVVEPFCSHPHMDLYVGAKSKHPVDKFGCTICHQGQGTATSFEWASHQPNDQATMDRWSKNEKWFFNHFHELPMYPSRFVEASCLKCHHDPYQIPEAKKVLAGYKTIKTVGCYGCHEIDGYKDDGTSIGPNLRLASPVDNAFERSQATRKVGPSLARISEKLSKDFLWKWIRDPRAFRPSTKMPSFYKQMDSKFHGEGPADEFVFPGDEGENHQHALAALGATEIHAMTEFLLSISKKHLADPSTDKSPVVDAPGDVARGKELFATKGCVACHNHKEQKSIEAKGFGPDLSELQAKFQTPEQKKWLASWIKNPAAHNPLTYMPSLQLTDQEAADLAVYLVSVPGKYAKDLQVPPIDKAALRDLSLSFERKGTDLDSARKRIDGMSTEEQLLYLGQKTVARLGCFGCHNIPGYETAKPIGVALTDWGRKDPHKISFENAVQYVRDSLEHLPAEEKANHFYTKNDYYLWALSHHQREGFLMQKLREPRSYDEGKIRRWEDRTRMPQFNLDDEEREAVATFVLGLVGETINRKYVYNPSPAKQAEVKGRNLIETYNCQACHVFKPGEYQVTPIASDVENLMAFGKKELDGDYSFPGHSAWSVPKDKINHGTKMVVRGLPDGEENKEEADNPEDPRHYVRLWEASSVKGQVIPAGAKVGIPSSQYTPASHTPPYGGKFAETLVDLLVSKAANPTAAGERDKAWQKAPPPLIREGEKVQTQWLATFLLEPGTIRPATVLRMPKFNYREGDTQALAEYFAAADGQPYPYVAIPERESSYLAPIEVKRPEYLEDAWKLVTNKELCIKCHPVGGIQPVGKPEELGPMLSRAPDRLRPDWMYRWIANPGRLVPYTAMPVNFKKDEPKYQELFKGSSAEQVRAARDALINYNRVMDKILTKQQAATKPAGADKGGM